MTESLGGLAVAAALPRERLAIVGPSVLPTLVLVVGEARRDKLLSFEPSPPSGMDPDEYPPAMSRGKGTGLEARRSEPPSHLGRKVGLATRLGFATCRTPLG